MMISLSLITLFLAWFGLRQYGLSQSYSQTAHPLMELKKPLVFSHGGWFGDDINPYSIQSFIKLSNKSPHLVPSGHVYLSKDDKWYLFEATKVQKDNNFRNLESDELNVMLTKGILKGFSLDELAKSEFKGPVAFFVETYDRGDAESFNKWLKANQYQDRVFVFSRHDGFLRDLRKINPSLVFSVGQAKLTQFLLLDSYGLESLGRLKNDFVVFDPRFAEKISVKPSTVIEIHRQKKLIFVEGVSSVKTAKELIDKGIDGFTTKNPSEIVTIFESSM